YSLPDHVSMVPFIFANAFDEFGVGKQIERYGGGPRFGVCLGVIKSDLDVHVSKVGALEAFGNTQRLAMRMPRIVKPALIVEADSIDDQSVAFPFANGISEPAWTRFRRKAAAVRENLAIMIELLIQNHYTPGVWTILNGELRTSIAS